MATNKKGDTQQTTYPLSCTVHSLQMHTYRCHHSSIFTTQKLLGYASAAQCREQGMVLWQPKSACSSLWEVSPANTNINCTTPLTLTTRAASVLG